MNSLEKNMINSLIDLKENYHAVSVKAEFEAEGTRMEEAMRLKEIATRAGLDLTIKIGGCEAIKDMYDAKVIGANAIVAPMVESEYALKKFVLATKSVFSEDERKDIKFFVNIETITGFNNLDKMIKSEYFNDIEGIVFGRVDMAGSLGLTRDNVDSEKMLELAKSAANKISKYGKNFVVGGEVSAKSIPFFSCLLENSLTKFETRKVIFDAKNALEDKNTVDGILKAIGFELQWLKNKKEFYKNIFLEDEFRFKILEARYGKTIEASGGINV